MSWQAHVYGTASPQLERWCKEHELPLHVFAWRPQYRKAGFAQDALYLIRPDTYVALARASGAADSLQRYFEKRGIRPPAALAGGPPRVCRHPPTAASVRQSPLTSGTTSP
jgi:hypothetical protein